MRTRRYALISFLITVVFVVFVAISLMLQQDYEIIIATAFNLFQCLAASWILCIINLIFYFITGKNLPGKKSYHTVILILFIIDVLFSVISIIVEHGFKYSSGRMVIFYIIPVMFLLILMTNSWRKKDDGEGIGS